ncbi:MAG: imidazole glycerol phosphate synthase subunit HisH, partial [Alphaproteobacteria bacterium]|nr:imidazole glycerol phosphate synthase subunit HisH [Alphaproteobacteria bacterium]
PILGICVGMQLMVDFSLEHGHHPGLQWIQGEVRKIVPQDPKCRIPHVGWNDVYFQQSFGGFSAGDSANFYFDHSFAIFNAQEENILAKADHGETFAAALISDNIVAAQFHPEKSQEAGIKFLNAFLSF